VQLWSVLITSGKLATQHRVHRGSVQPKVNLDPGQGVEKAV